MHRVSGPMQNAIKTINKTLQEHRHLVEESVCEDRNVGHKVCVLFFSSAKS